MADEMLSYTRGTVHDEAMIADPLFSVILHERAGARARARTGVNFVNFGHPDTAR
jgi:hypothetical protein